VLVGDALGLTEVAELVEAYTSLEAIDGSGADDVWIAGTRLSDWTAPYPDALLYHWDGEAWSTHIDYGSDHVARGVWRASDGVVWTLGQNRIRRFDGEAFSDHTFSLSDDEIPLALRAPGGVPWMTGAGGLLRRWDGAAFADDSVYGLGAAFADLWGPADGDLFLVGSYGTVARRQGGELTLWRHATFAHASGLWVAGPDFAVTVGPSTSSCFFFFCTTEPGVIREWNGSRWERRAGHGNAVSGTSPDDVWAVGDGGIIAHRDGDGWSEVGSPVETELMSVFASADDVWAVGADGVVLRRGATGGFEPVDSGTSDNLYAVWGASPADVWIGGDGGTLLHWYDDSLHAVDSGTTVGLRGLHGSGPDDVWAVGTGGVILHRTAGGWASETSPTDYALGSVHASSASEAYAVSSHGELLAWDGEAWALSLRAFAARFRAVHGAGGQMWVADSDGMLLRRQ
jgi:hypothetical protein